MKELSRLEGALIRHQMGLYGAALMTWSAVDLATSHLAPALIKIPTEIALFTLEGIQVKQRRNAERSGTEVFNSKSITGVEVTHNTSTDLLERHLGITFPAKPSHVEMNQRNTIRLSRRHPIYSFGVRDSDAGGVYISELNTFFTKENAPLLTRLHESMHSYTHGTNPAFIEATALNRARIQNAMRERKKEVDFDAERYAAFVITDEGIAEWSAKRVFADIVLERTVNGQTITDLISNDNQYADRFANRIINLGDLKIDKPQDAEYGLVEDVVKEIKTSTSRQRPVRRVHAFRSSIRSFHSTGNMTSIYNIGQYFIDYTIQRLTNAGLSRSDALNRIIYQPPVTFAEIRQTENYATDLLKSA